MSPDKSIDADGVGRHVRTIVAIAAVAISTGSSARASEGLLATSLYYCDAQVMNTAIVRLCSAKDPQLAARGRQALAAWSSRFGEKAAAAAKKCEAGPERRATPEEVAEFHATLEILRAKWLADIESRVRSNPAICQQALSHLENSDKFEEGM